MRARATVLTIGLIGLTVFTAPAPTTARDCESWGVLLPRDEARERFLDDVAAASPCLAWAVGSVYEASTYRTLILRWDGTEWAEVPSPNRVGSNSLVSVTVASANDVWAVGMSWGPSSQRNLILHWDGTEWSIVRSPRPYDCDQLEGVVATSSTNAWAVGSSCGASEAIIFRWNGTAWRSQDPPDVPGTSDRLTAVTATGASEAWAVGQFEGGALTLRWNGDRWTRRKTPDLAAGAVLYGVAIPTSGRAIAVGRDDDGLLALHWNGTEWRRRTTPGTWSYNGELADVTAASPTEVWAAGSGWGDDGSETVVLRWDGSRWKRKSTPNVDLTAPYGNELYGIDAVPGGGVWAVGINGPAPPQPMILHCC